MRTARIEAFSDAVIAIAMTIMVLELKIPHSSNWQALRPLIPVFLTYVLSYAFLGIYWNNHHHMLHVAEHANGSILWANLHLLFWLSLIPFVTGWMGENHLAAWPVAAYGVVLLCASVAYLILQGTIIAAQGPESILRQAVGRDVKGKVSSGSYVLAIVLAFFAPRISIGLYIFVALLWLIPDRRIESRLQH